MAQGTPELIEALGQIDPSQPYGTELFNALVRLQGGTAIEFVWLRLTTHWTDGVCYETGGNVIIVPAEQYFTLPVEVYMTLRGKGEANSGEWHCPGSFIKGGDEKTRGGETFEDVLERLVKNEAEFGPDARLVSATHVDDINPPRFESGRRGHIISKVYLCEVKTKGELPGRWFPVFPKLEVPENTVTSHWMRIIPCAIGKFMAKNPYMPVSCSQLDWPHGPSLLH